ARGYVDTLEDSRLKAAFRYIEAVGNLPTSVSADTHAMLRMHYIDRQIAELMDLAAINNSNAVHDRIVPIVTDQETLEWALANLKGTSWSPDRNLGSKEEQRANPFVGEALIKAQQEIYSGWVRTDRKALNPEFQTDWINFITGYGVPEITFDGDFDGIEEPFDAFPVTWGEWITQEQRNANRPAPSTPAFDTAAYDYAFFRPAKIPPAQYPFSDRAKFDTEWTRESSLGTLEMDAYLLIRDRALPVEMKWQLFFVYQLASGCTHCQVHGSFGVFKEMEEDFIDKEVPPEDMPGVVAKIRALMDFERADHLSVGEKAALRLARDAGRLPGNNTAAHIEELRRHYSDREIQEIIATLVLTGWLATSMQSQATVTDRLSMSWAMRHLGPVGWNPGVHTGLPNEQRPYHMSELFGKVLGEQSMGEISDAASEWVGIDVPRANDTDEDGVDDFYDGFPTDPSRWADTDRDGIEDAMDPDIDGDGIANSDEIASGTFPYKADSDGDGIGDAQEVANGTDPLNPRAQ
ncbi:MAG: hypothetical protein AAFS13_08730, partial [Pseudomonadota bacterium]